jgi:hypothetical protein
MKWYLAHDCSNLGVKTPEDNETTVKPEHLTKLENEDSLRKYLKESWLHDPERNTVEIFSTVFPNFERKAKQEMDEIVEKMPQFFNPRYLVPLDDDLKLDLDHQEIDLDDEINDINLKDDEGGITIIHVRSDNEGYYDNKATEEDIHRWDNYISEVLDNMPLNKLTPTNFSQNSDCCKICIYKSEAEEEDISFTRQDMLALFVYDGF